MKAHSSPAALKPIVLRQGSVSVTIYRGVNRIYRPDADGERKLHSEHPQFTLAYYHGSRRVRLKFTDLDKAKEEANLTLTKLANGDSEALKLTGTDRADYVKATQRIRAWKESADLSFAVADYVDAMTRLPESVSLRECVNFFLKRHPASLAPKTVPEVVDEFIAAKKAAGKSDVYLRDLTCRLRPFAKAFNVRIVVVMGQEIETYLRGLGVAPRTQNNVRRIIGTLFQFAMRRGYLPKDHSEIDGVEKIVVPPSEIEVFTPDELRKLLLSVRPEMVPYIAIGAFAGLRAAELDRLDWSEVNLISRHVEVTAAKAKTASRRLVPIAENLATWLAPYAQQTGSVAPFANMSKQLTEVLAPRAGFEWKHNGLRHSFISYRVAVLKNIAEVAIEAGNSPQMIFKHYRALVTEDQGREWFGIMPPPRAANIVPLAVAA